MRAIFLGFHMRVLPKSLIGDLALFANSKADKITRFGCFCKPGYLQFLSEEYFWPEKPLQGGKMAALVLFSMFNLTAQNS